MIQYNLMSNQELKSRLAILQDHLRELHIQTDETKLDIQSIQSLLQQREDQHAHHSGLS